jgi:NAD dependent epimerase/dehydratase family enzyme
MFVGGPIASGAQVVSWVHVDDVARAVMRCLDDDGLSGPVNVTAPNAVTNEELSREIGAVLSRPSLFRVPEAALRLRFGEGADPLVTGQRAVPGALLRAGYEWRFTDVRAALADILAK